jgi:hypothetical protein
VIEAKRAPSAELSALIADAFCKAKARWSPFLLLGRPVIDDEGILPGRVDLKTRTISLGARGILQNDLMDALEAILAHEIGHLVAAPASRVAEARLLLLERAFLPRREPSLTRSFFELMVDERLGPSLADARTRVLVAEAKSAPLDPAMLFQRAVLEELWQRDPGDLMAGGEAELAEAFPDYRIEAKLVAQNLFALAPSVPLQFLYYASVLYRYVPAADPDDGEGGCECMEGEPSGEDFAEALVPQASEKAAVKRAVAERWFPGDVAEALKKSQSLEQRVAGIPGSGEGRAELVTEVMAAHYRREAERWLFQPPQTVIEAEELVPTTLEEWDPGDPVASIDWVSTLLQRGPTLGAAMPLLRERIPDEEGRGAPMWEGRTEIYLDVSGSMPDPKQSLNAMTLAAQILALGTVRAGGAARALVYSTGHEAHWTFCRSESILSRFLLHYIGQGTDFPFEMLAASVAALGASQPVRFIITDSDFDSNYDKSGRNAAVFAEAAARSAALVLLLHKPTAARVALYEAAGARVVGVQRLEDFPRLSAALSFALFEQGSLPAGGDPSSPRGAVAPDPFAHGARHVLSKKLVR